MTTTNILETIKDFLEENVCKDVKLKKASDDVSKFELVTPKVSIMNYPPYSHLPESMVTDIPCISVTFKEGSDDNKEAEIEIKLIFAVYNPGFQQVDANGTIQCTHDDGGWTDLINLLDKTRAELLKNQILNGVTLKFPVKWGIYKNKKKSPTDTFPYYYGWITFYVKDLSYPTSEIEKLIF